MPDVLEAISLEPPEDLPMALGAADLRAIHAGVDNPEALLSRLPNWIAEAARENLETLEEIKIRLGEPVALCRSGCYSYTERTATAQDVLFTTQRVKGFRDDGRTGIDGTVHRISVVRDRYEASVGITVRVGRFVIGVAEPLRPYLEPRGVSMVLIGPPGSGKSTLLRDLVRILGELIGPKCLAVDTSNEIGGDGQVKHPSMGRADRIQVPSTEVQGEIIRQAVANHGPEVVVVDEIGYHNDVAILLTTARRGVQVIATAHGSTLLDLVENPVLDPLLGDPDPVTRLPRSRGVFRVGLEVRAKGLYWLYPDLEAALAQVRNNESPRAKEIRLDSSA